MNKGFWKRIVAVVMICSVLLSGMALAESLFEKDSSLESFDLAIMAAVGEVGAEEWMTDEEVRGLGTLLLAFDFQLSGDLEIDIVNEEKPTYIGRNGSEVICYLPTEEGQGVVIFYEESAETASYKLVGDVSAEEVEAAMSEVCPDGYYSNTPEMMVEVGLQLYNLLDSNSEE